MEPKDITEEMHQDFYRFTTNLFDSPQYHLQYKIDAPLNIRALFCCSMSRFTAWDANIVCPLLIF
jgi:TNF receptor-associated protein 1